MLLIAIANSVALVITMDWLPARATPHVLDLCPSTIPIHYLMI